MRILKLIMLFLLGITNSISAQQHNNIDEIGSFNEDLMSIKKGDSWGFVDKNGAIMIDFRKDIVGFSKEPPIFSNGLCLIKEKRKDVIYYGYINTKGKTIIPTEYIVATSFKNGFASVIKYYKTDTGTNTFGQHVVYYSYNELIITTKNKPVLSIGKSRNLLLSKLKLQQEIPIIRSKFINENLVRVKEDDGTYSIYNLDKL
jgi:hypothetical protein